MAALQDPSEYAVQGAVRVLKEFARDLTDSQIPNVAPVIIPDMYRIFMEQERYTIRTRTRAIEIFTTMASMICAMAEVNKSLSKSLLGPILPTFTDALIDGLSIPDDSHLTDAGLKTEVLKGKTNGRANCRVERPCAQPLPPTFEISVVKGFEYERKTNNPLREIVINIHQLSQFANSPFPIHLGIRHLRKMSEKVPLKE